jgi:hypothetical protein
LNNTNYKLVRSAIAFTWLYHALIPKIIWQAPQELEMARRSMGGLIDPVHMTIGAGILEIFLALFLIIFWKKKFPLYITIVCMSCLTVGVFIFWPQLVFQTFNPITINVLMIVLSIVNLNQLKEMGVKDESSRNEGGH